MNKSPGRSGDEIDGNTSVLLPVDRLCNWRDAMSRLAVIRSVLSERQLRRVEFSIIGFGMAEHGTWLAINVYAYQRGGVEEAGIVAFTQLVVAAVLAPLLAFTADRFGRDKVLAAGYGGQAITFGLTALAMWSSVPALAVYVAAIAAASMVTVSRPTIASVLPSLADTPATLTAANVVASLAEQTGMFIGPAFAGVVLVTSGPAAVFGGAAGLMAVTALSMTRLRLRPGAAAAVADETVSATVSELSAGLRVVVRDHDTRLLVSLMVLLFILAGALDIAFIAVAIDLIERSEATAGLFSMASGLGGAIGAMLAVVMVGRRRLTWPLALGIFASGFAIVATAAPPPLAVLVLLFALNGAGTAITDIAGRTMLQGMSPDDVLARVFGVLESLTMAAMAVGSLAFSLAAVAFGIRGALVAVGLMLPLTLILWLRQLLAIDHARPEVDPAMLRLVRSVSIFAPLPAYAVEQLMVNFVEEHHEPGSEIIRKGDAGDAFYLIVDGVVEVEMPDASWVPHGPGDFVGEIALLLDVPRSANVRSGPMGVDVLALERDVFLEAVTGHHRSLSRAESIADTRLRQSDDR